jgi:hypothetical protein
MRARKWRRNLMSTPWGRKPLFGKAQFIAGAQCQPGLRRGRTFD